MLAPPPVSLMPEDRGHPFGDSRNTMENPFADPVADARDTDHDRANRVLKLFDLDSVQILSRFEEFQDQEWRTMAKEQVRGLRAILVAAINEGKFK